MLEAKLRAALHDLANCRIKEEKLIGEMEMDEKRHAAVKQVLAADIEQLKKKVNLADASVKIQEALRKKVTEEG